MKIDYDKQIPLLIKLQEFDLELSKLRQDKKSMPLQLEAIRKMIEEKKQDIQSAEDEIKAVKVEIKDKELELHNAEDGIKKFQQQLLQIKTNKEYKALLAEIGGKKADNSCIEDEILDLMDKLDQKELKLNREKGSLKEIEKEFQQEEVKIKKKMQEVEDAIKKEAAKREEIASKIDSEVLSVYTKLINNQDGLAIVPVVDEACGGCHLSLRPQTINEIKRAQILVTCERCSRIFYLNE